MKTMTMKTAIKKAKEGYFEFKFNAKVGNNEIRRQTPSGKWVNDLLYVIADRRIKKYTDVTTGNVASKAAWVSKFNKTEMRLAGITDKEVYFNDLLHQGVLVQIIELGDRVKLLINKGYGDSLTGYNVSAGQIGTVVRVNPYDFAVLWDGRLLHMSVKTHEIEAI